MGKQKIPNEKRTKCEVWSRAVGYLRPVEQWHQGKQAEFKDRVKSNEKFGGKTTYCLNKEDYKWFKFEEKNPDFKEYFKDIINLLEK